MTSHRRCSYSSRSKLCDGDIPLFPGATRPRMLPSGSTAFTVLSSKIAPEAPALPVTLADGQVPVLSPVFVVADGGALVQVGDAPLDLGGAEIV